MKTPKSLHPLMALTPDSRLLPSPKYTFHPITSLRIDKWAKNRIFGAAEMEITR